MEGLIAVVNRFSEKALTFTRNVVTKFIDLRDQSNICGVQIETFRIKLFFLLKRKKVKRKLNKNILLGEM